MSFTPHTGDPCGCRPGVHRDNCLRCEGTGMVIDFKAIHARRLTDQLQDLDRDARATGPDFQQSERAREDDLGGRERLGGAS